MTRATLAATRRKILFGLGAALAAPAIASPGIAQGQAATTLRMWTFLNPAGNAPR